MENLEFELKLLIDMQEQNVEVKNVKVSEGGLTFKEKTMKYLSAQIEAKKEKMARYENGLSDSELSPEFITKRENARLEYDLLVEVRLTLDML